MRIIAIGLSPSSKGIDKWSGYWGWPMASSNEKLLPLALPILGVLDVLETTIVYIRQGELLTERNPIVKSIAGAHNLVLYYLWSVLYILFLTFVSRWLVSESYKAKRGQGTVFGRLLGKGKRDEKSIDQYDPQHFYVVLYSCLIGLYIMIIATNSFVLRVDAPTFVDNLVAYVMALFITASVAYYLTKAS
jgi:hypothetical protein